MNKNIKHLIVYLVLLIGTFLIWLLSPSFLPAGAFRSERFCDWGGHCVEPQPIIGIIFNIIIVIVSIVLLLLTIKTIIKLIKKQ